MNSSKKLTLKLNPLVLSYCILIFFDVYNRSKYGTGVGVIRYAFTTSFALLVLYLIMLRKVRIQKKELIFGFILMASPVISTIFSSTVSWIVDGYSLLLCIIFYLIQTMIEVDYRLIRKIMRFYVFISLFYSVWILYDFLHGINVGWSSGVSINILGEVKDPNYLAAFLVPGFSYMLYSYLYSEKKNVYALCISFIVLCGIFFTGSRGAFLTAIFSGTVILAKIIVAEKWSLKKIVIFVVLLMLITMGYIGFSNSVLASRMLNTESYAGNIRLIIWKKAMQAFWNNPLLGSGLQSGAYYSRDATLFVTHNCFIDILTGQGIIGAATYVFVFIDFFKVGKQNIYFMIAMFISFFGPLFFVNGYEGITFWLPMMMCYQLSTKCKETGCKILIN